MRVLTAGNIGLIMWVVHSISHAMISTMEELMARPSNIVQTSKATYSLPQTQVEYLEARAKAQTEVLRHQKAKHPVVYPSHLVSLAVSFYQRYSDIVENTLEWKGRVPIEWPKREDRADRRPLSENAAPGAAAAGAGDSQSSSVSAAEPPA